MKLYYEIVSSEEEIGNDNDGFSCGLYWYDDQTGDNLVDAQWFESERERDKFIAENKMIPLK